MPRHNAREWAALVIANSRWNTRRGTLTTPRYFPISTPNSTAWCSAFQWASSGKVKNNGASGRALGSNDVL